MARLFNARSSAPPWAVTACLTRSFPWADAGCGWLIASSNAEIERAYFMVFLPCSIVRLSRSVLGGAGGTLVLGTGCLEYALHGVVSLVTRVFIQRGVALHHRNRCRPRFGKRGWIVHGDLIVDGIRIGAREALDQMEMRSFAIAIRHAEAGHVPIGEVGHIHHQRIALPMASRIAHPLPDIPADVRPSVQRNDAGLMHQLGQHDNRSRNLQNSIVVVIPAGKHGIGQSARDAARDHADVLIRIERTVPRGAGRAGAEPLESLFLPLLAGGR